MGTISQLLVTNEQVTQFKEHFTLGGNIIKISGFNRALIASHDLNLALRFCDQLLILSRQGVLAMGTPEEVLTVDHLRTNYGIESRIEACSKGFPIVLADNAVSSKY